MPTIQPVSASRKSVDFMSSVADESTGVDVQVTPSSLDDQKSSSDDQ